MHRPGFSLRIAQCRLSFQTYKFSPDRVRFTYVLMEKQAEFVQSLTSSSSTDELSTAPSPSDPLLRIAILWRREEKKLNLEWTSEPWDASPERNNKSEEELRKTLQRLLRANEVKRRGPVHDC